MNIMRSCILSRCQNLAVTCLELKVRMKYNLLGNSVPIKNKNKKSKPVAWGKPPCSRNDPLEECFLQDPIEHSEYQTYYPQGKIR